MNRILQRQLRKFLQVNSEEELPAIRQYFTKLVAHSKEVPPGVSHFLDGFDDFFEALDKGLNEYDRVLKARETSLEITEAELNHASSLMKEDLAKREVALMHLNKILMKSDFSPASTSDELVDLVSRVEGLVRSQLERSEDLRLIFGMSLKISGSRNLQELESALIHCLNELLEVPSQVVVYFHTRQFGLGVSESNYVHRINDGINPFSPFIDLREVRRSGDFIVPIETQGELEPTLIVVSTTSDNEKRRRKKSKAQEIIKALSPSILSTCKVIHHIEQEKSKLLMEADLLTARLVQKTLIPPATLFIKNEMYVASWFQTASECGGDWWNHYKLRDGRHLFVIADVTGHGTGSALLTAMVKGYCDAVAAQVGFEIYQFLIDLDRHIYQVGNQIERSLSMLVVTFDPQTRLLEIVNAAHPSPFLILQDKQNEAPGILNLNNSAGPLLGFEADGISLGQLSKNVFKVGPRDKLILFTDGLIESKSQDGRIFSDRYLLRFIRSIPLGLSALEWRDQIHARYEKFCGQMKPADDISLVVVEFLVDQAEVFSSSDATN